jgi:hypothetical protein
MEVTSLTFAGGSRNARPAVNAEPIRAGGRVPSQPGGAGSVYAPSITLPLRFILAGLVSLCVGVGWLAFRPEILTVYHYGSQVIALAHLFVLGWITSTIMGATYQLAPVALETKLFSESWARIQFWFHLAGFVGMTWMFWVWNLLGVIYFGLLFAAAVGMFVYNIGRTLRSAPRRSVVSFGISSSLVWLSLTVLAGLFLAASKRWEFSPFTPLAQMHAHAHLGGIGFFLTMMMGVSFKLLPMFLLSEVRSARRAWWSMMLLNAGLAGLFVAMLFSHPLKLAFSVVIAVGISLYLAEIAAIVRGRKRSHLDWSMRSFLLAISLLAPLSILGIVLNWPGLPGTLFTLQLENLYGFLGFFGVVTFGMMGMLYKIVPFLVWIARYSSEVGKSKVPSLAELYSARMQAVSCWLFISGLLAVSWAILMQNQAAMQWCWLLIAGSIAALAVNMGMILRHYFHPNLQPLSFSIQSELVPRRP